MSYKDFEKKVKRSGIFRITNEATKSEVFLVNINFIYYKLMCAMIMFDDVKVDIVYERVRERDQNEIK